MELKFGKLGLSSLLTITTSIVFFSASCENPFKLDKSVTNPTPKPISDSDKASIEQRKNLEEISKNGADLVKLPKTQLSPDAYLKGKIVVFKTSGLEPLLVNTASPITPDEIKMKELMATSMDEIGTIVLFPDNTKKGSCKDVEKGTYKAKDGKLLPSYEEVCEVLIIDRTIPAVVFKKTFQGKLQENEVVDKYSVPTGRVRDNDVYEWLSGLQRR